MLFSKSKVCFGPEIEEPGVRRHIEIIGSIDKYSLGGERFRFYSLNVMSDKLLLITNFTFITEEIE